MISSDKEFFTVYFDSINGRLTRIEERQGEQEEALMKIQSEQQLINRIDFQDRLIWGGFSCFTLIIMFMMFLQSFRDRNKSESKTDLSPKSILTWESVSELLHMIKHD